jgi:hypothetical protein
LAQLENEKKFGTQFVKLISEKKVY